MTDVGKAHAQYDDWLGTSAADDADPIIGTRSKYEMVGLDPEKWTILGFGLSRWRGVDTVVVYALDTQANGVSTHDDLQALARRGRGKLPVTAFSTDMSFIDFIDEGFKRFSTVFKSRGIVDHELDVVDQQEI